MADSKISALTPATAPAATDEFAVNQSGTSRKMTLAQIEDFAAPGAYDHAVVTMATGSFLLQYNRLAISSTNRFTMAGTAELVLSSFASVDNVYMGSPKTPATSWTIPTDWFWDVIARLTLPGLVRATLQGTADLILSDDFKTRSRIVLAGGPS